MSFREYMNNNPAVMTGAAVAVLVICLGIVACQLTGGGPAGSGSQVIYFDVASGEIKLVEAVDSVESPVAGTENYRAAVATCEDECGEIEEGMDLEQLKANGMFVAFVERTATGRNANAFDDFGSNTDVRLIGDEYPDTWVPAGHPQNMVIQSLDGRCPGASSSFAKRCFLKKS